MYTLLHIAVLALTFIALARIVPGVQIKNGKGAVVVALVFSVLNWALGWMLKAVLVLPAVLTLGLLWLFVPFIVTATILWLTDELLDVIEIRSFKALLLSAAGITLANVLFRLLLRS